MRHDVSLRPIVRRMPGRMVPALAFLTACLAVCLAGIAGLALAQAGDAFGDGSLLPPTSPRFADPAWYDLVDVRLLEGDPIRITVTMGAIDASGGLPLGITQPIVEIYLDTVAGGVEALLPGSGLSMPIGDGWQIAVRVTGDGAWAWHADEDGTVDLAAPVPIEVVVDGTELTILTPFARPEEPPSVYAVSGVYDPFRVDGWRPLSRDPSPWAFSSDQQVVSVVDVFPGDAAARAAALARGELPRATRTPALDPRTRTWVWLMVAGLAIALVGVGLRARAARGTRHAVRTEPATGALSAAPIRDVRAAPLPEGVELIDEAELGAWSPPEASVGAGGQSLVLVPTVPFPPAPLALPAPRAPLDAAPVAAPDAPDAPDVAEAAEAAGAPTAAGAEVSDDASDAASDESETAAPSERSREASRS